MSAIYQALEADKQRRIAACTEELEAVLKKWDCRLEFHITLHSSGRLTPQMNVVAGENREGIWQNG